MVRLKGAIKRAIKEYRYFTSRNWTYIDVGDFWDSVYDYDEVDGGTYAYKRRFTDTVGMCTLNKKSKILDVDCRTGNGIVFYYQNGKLSEAVCVSPSKVFLNICKDRLRKHNINGKTMLLRKLPLDLEDGAFDGILCFETVEHVSDHEEFLRELNRLLKPGGEMILTMPNLLWQPVHWIASIFDIHHSEGPSNFIRRVKMLRLLKKSGFKVIKDKTTVLIPSGPRWLIKFGEILEKLFSDNLMHLLGLRRVFICKKV